MHDDSCKVELPRRRKQEKPIPSVYPVLDTDLARDNVENDIPAADPEDLLGLRTSSPQLGGEANGKHFRLPGPERGPA